MTGQWPPNGLVYVAYRHRKDYAEGGLGSGGKLMLQGHGSNVSRET